MGSTMHAERFTAWFTKLLDNIDNQGIGKQLIVMDNAPYHTMSYFPSKRANKATLLSFLTKMKADGKLPDTTFDEKMRNWELYEIVEDLKKKYPQPTIDAMAQERGHEVCDLILCSLSRLTIKF